MSIAKALNLFSTGDNSGATSARARVGRLILSALKLASLLLFALILVGMGQLGQIMLSVNDLRMKTIADWKIDNPTQYHVADEFIETCLNRGLVKREQRSINDEPVSIYKCGENIGASGLVDRVKSADEVLESAAWPLSIIE